jgi:hypothetical protein
VVGLGHAALHAGWPVEQLLALGLNTPTYGYAYHDAAVDGLSRLAGRPVPRPVESRFDQQLGAESMSSAPRERGTTVVSKRIRSRPR